MVTRKMKKTERSYPVTSINYGELMNKQNIRNPMFLNQSRSILRAKSQREPTKPVEPNLSYKTRKPRRKKPVLNTTHGSTK